MRDVHEEESSFVVLIKLAKETWGISQCAVGSLTNGYFCLLWSNSHWMVVAFGNWCSLMTVQTLTNFAGTMSPFMEPLLLSVSDFSWLCPWFLKPGWMHCWLHYYCCLRVMDHQSQLWPTWDTNHEPLACRVNVLSIQSHWPSLYSTHKVGSTSRQKIYVQCSANGVLGLCVKYVEKLPRT